MLHRLGPQLSAWTGIGPVDGTVPEFEIALLDGGAFGTDSLSGRVTVVNFWATWCLPCRVEIPALQKLHEAYPSGDVRVIGISSDRRESDIRSYLREHGVTYPIGRIDEATRRAFGGVSLLPTTFILDREGRVQHRVEGLFAPPAMRAAVERLLRPDGTGDA